MPFELILKYIRNRSKLQFIPPEAVSPAVELGGAVQGEHQSLPSAAVRALLYLFQMCSIRDVTRYGLA